MIRLFRAVLRWHNDVRYGWQRRLAAYLMVVAAFTLCLVQIQHNYRADTARAQAQATLSCSQLAQGRQVLRELVTVAYSASAVDYSKVPSYNDLDPATRQFLQDLGAGGTRQTQRRDEVLAKVPPITCPPPKR